MGKPCTDAFDFRDHHQHQGVLTNDSEPFLPVEQNTEETDAEELLSPSPSRFEFMRYSYRQNFIPSHCREEYVPKKTKMTNRCENYPSCSLRCLTPASRERPCSPTLSSCICSNAALLEEIGICIKLECVHSGDMDKFWRVMGRDPQDSEKKVHKMVSYPTLRRKISLRKFAKQDAATKMEATGRDSEESVQGSSLPERSATPAFSNIPLPSPPPSPLPSPGFRKHIKQKSSLGEFLSNIRDHSRPGTAMSENVDAHSVLTIKVTKTVDVQVQVLDGTGPSRFLTPPGSRGMDTDISGGVENGAKEGKFEDIPLDSEPHHRQSEEKEKDTNSDKVDCRTVCNACFEKALAVQEEAAAREASNHATIPPIHENYSRLRPRIADQTYETFRSAQSTPTETTAFMNEKRPQVVKKKGKHSEACIRIPCHELGELMRRYKGAGPRGIVRIVQKVEGYFTKISKELRKDTDYVDLDMEREVEAWRLG